ncbi:response regulator [Pseudomonas tohonis]|uniref:Response regulator n=1 Tax=Pseudomonas tohonis TaxID=2725477 RepID=A0A6J4E3C0_9PSED|nr:response regulator [Pseudomonas tohonis]BCG24257.1 response regulator [Pseudomonas tohonis]GJN52389.1 response regulator [Pseudomonas tohonis]
MRVQIVDDDPWIANLLQQLVLSVRPGAEIDSFAAVQAAVDAWRSNRYQLVVVDWNLPDGTGLDVMQKIRRIDRTVPLLVVTGRADRESVMAARPMGISAYITKPFDVPKVIACLESLLPGDAQAVEPEAQQGSFEEHLRGLTAEQLDVPLLADVKDKLQQASRGVPMDFQELAADWNRDPALCAYLIAAANSATYGSGQAPCISLPDALKRMGARTCMNHAIALALRQAGSTTDPFLKLFLQNYLDEIEQLSETVVRTARQCGLDHGPLQAAALLYRLGEMCVIFQAQQWMRQSRQSLDDNTLTKAIADFAEPLAIRLKAHWGLPMALRDLIGACYALPQFQVRQEQVVMRLAAAQCVGESAAEIERLKRLAGVG